MREKSTNLRPPLRHPPASRAVRARDYGRRLLRTPVFEVLGFDEINMVAAYGGFPNRYPHWRFGMEYERLSQGVRVRLSKIYEDGHQTTTPPTPTLLESNMDVGPEAG